jgi:membrane associated rhomboid family serine protease
VAAADRRSQAVTWLRSIPVTLAVTAVTLGFFVVQLAWPPLLELLQRDGSAVADGQWWRLVTSMLLHGGGWAHVLFNLLGIVLVGAAVERGLGWWRWLIIYVVAGVGAGALQVAVYPEALDSGASGGLAGLIGALALLLIRGRRASAASMAFAAFFTTYLAALLWLGPIAGAVMGSAAAGIVGTVARRADRVRLGRAVAIVVAVGTLALLLGWDVHGQGVLLGFAAAWLLRHRARTRLESAPSEGGAP